MFYAEHIVYKHELHIYLHKKKKKLYVHIYIKIERFVMLFIHVKFGINLTLYVMKGQ